MSKSIGDAVRAVSKIVAVKVVAFKVKLADLKSAGSEIVGVQAGIVAGLNKLQKDLTIPFCVDVAMGVRQGVVVDARAFLLGCGFDDNPDNPLTVGTVTRYVGHCANFLNSGFSRSQIVGIASLTNLTNGSSKAKHNIGVTTGKPKADFVQATQKSGAGFRKDCSDKIWNETETRQTRAQVKALETAPKKAEDTEPKADYNKADTSDKAPSIEGVKAFIGLLSGDDAESILTEIRVLCNDGIKKIRAQNRKAVA